MQFEKKYWSKGEFTNSKGDEFNGYVGILDGEAYDYKTYEKLIGKDTYLARINCSKKNFDRTLSQRLQLHIIVRMLYLQQMISYMQV